MFRRLSLILVCALLPTVVAAQTMRAPTGERGWHFYAPDPPPAKPKPRLPAPAPVAAAPSSSEGPAPLSTAWLRENMQRYMDAAMDNPTPENLELYGLLQRMTLDKAERFSYAYQQVLTQSPALDPSSSLPMTALGRSARNEVMTAAKQAALTKVAGQAGLFFFFRSDCPYCHRQAPLLMQLQERLGLRVLPISLDGAPMPGLYPQFVVDQGQARRMQVRATPTLVLVRPPLQFQTLAVGIRTMPELEDRMLDVGLAMGLLSQVEYDEAKRGAPVDYLVADHVPRELLVAAADDPSTLLALLRSAAVSGGSSDWSAP